MNLGCPQGIARKGKYGSYLLPNYNLVEQIAKALGGEEVRFPFTVKIRLLPSLDDTIKLCKMLERGGAQMITVGVDPTLHSTDPRTNARTEQRSNGLLQLGSHLHNPQRALHSSVRERRHLQSCRRIEMHRGNKRLGRNGGRSNFRKSRLFCERRGSGRWPLNHSRMR